MIRARRPYLVRNAVTGLGLFAFTAGVCKTHIIPRFAHAALTDILLDFWTMKKIGQDDFEDVKVPDAPAASTSK